MEREEFMRLTDILLEEEEVTFTYENHFIHIQERCEGGYDGSVYASEEDYENEMDCLDGRQVETIVAIAAVEFFIDISRDLTKRGL